MKNYFALLGTISSLIFCGTTPSAAAVVQMGAVPPAPVYFYITSTAGHHLVTAAFGDTFSGVTSFDETFLYPFPLSGTGSASVFSNNAQTTITNVLINGVSYSPAAAALGISFIPVNGKYSNTLEVIGQTASVDVTGSFSGTGTFYDTLGAVPEPATWAMMVIGMGIIGFAARRRQNASVSYA
jgi:hypothetical protein